MAEKFPAVSDVPHYVIDNKFGQIFVGKRNASPSRKMGLKMLSCLFNKVFKGEFSL